MLYVVEILKGTIEYQGWGWNAVGISTVGAVLVSFFNAWGLWSQNKKIWDAESGEGLSVVWFAYFAGFVVVGTLYGIHIHSAMVVFTCILIGAMHVPILIGLWKFKPWSKKEKIQFVGFCVCMPAMMLFTPWPEATFLLFAVGRIYSISTQPYEMLRYKKVGVLDARLVITQITAVVFWSIYGFATKTLALMVLNPILLLISVTTLFLWFFIPRRWPQNDHP
ncbi:MAG: hypothetical protein HYT93_03800 [Parcubacteria group bacterium]|nr:hypothetical protein [Parcubacteria group bacterium]